MRGGKFGPKARALARAAASTDFTATTQAELDTLCDTFGRLVASWENHALTDDEFMEQAAAAFIAAGHGSEN